MRICGCDIKLRVTCVFLLYVVANNPRCEADRLKVTLLVPSVALGRSALLNCSFEPVNARQEPETISRVRWFHDSEEVFRFNRLANEKLVFDRPGVFVDVHSSYDGVLRLKRTSPKSEAVYACELTTSRFRVGSASAPLMLYVLPRDEPQLIGVKARYYRGEGFNATCGLTAKPLPDLIWTVNGQQPPVNAIVTEQAEQHNGLSTVFSRLTFNTSTLPEDLLELKVACRADVLDVYQRTAERRVVFLHHLLAATATNGIADGLSPETETGPVIYGGRSHYHIGDVLNVTCVFAGPESVSLRWLLNEHRVPKQSLLHFLEEQTSSGVVRTALGIRFRVKSSHFDKGRLTIRCEAMVGNGLSAAIRQTTTVNRTKPSPPTTATPYSPFLNSLF
ncbi:uncharacterized protein LOC111251144 [Varroa destructor]|uniref:Ig-like domain-containing protein n=1 Tax=Varroa destructor TaxID=109461 RepID=A0A7M7KGD8_VARDE|nr:uncharacterized protein LOC111251144 [Varroa destructor]